MIALLTSALVGNHEAVRRFGIVITEATLKQELFRIGVKGNAANASNLAKVIARLNIVMRSTGDAQGDAARTSGSFANQMKALQATLLELRIELGDRVNRSILKAIKSMGGVAGVSTLARAGLEMVTRAFEFLAPRVANVAGLFVNWVRDVGGVEGVSLRLRMTFRLLGVSIRVAALDVLTSFRDITRGIDSFTV